MDKELAQSIGTAARAARKNLKLTQEEASERIGVSAEFYARIERGHALPSVQTLTRMCNALGVSADDLIGCPEPGPSDAKAKRWSGTLPNETPEVRRLLRRLRNSTPATLRLVTLLVKELEKRQ